MAPDSSSAIFLADEDKKRSFEQGFCKNCDLKQINGSLNYSYNLELPQGRNGLTPRVSINYSQFNRDISSIIGLGWDLSAGPYIERVSRFGANKIYSTNEFKLFSSGQAVKLKPINLTDGTHGSYAALTDEAFSSYEYLKDYSWIMTDNKGVKYYLGQSSASRQDDPNYPPNIYRWYVEKIEDTNGNVINYSYFKDKGQIYPKEIRYANAPASAGVYAIRFEPFASNNLTARPDISRSYLTGFRVETNYRLEEITVGTYEGENFSSKKQYRLDYANRANTKIYSLSGLTEAGWNGGGYDLKPKIEFGYDDQPNSWILDDKTPWSWTPDMQGDFKWRLNGDANNDGLLDSIMFKKDGSKEVYLNSGLDGWHKAEGSWNIPSEIDWWKITVINPPSQKIAMVDINGDQLDDIIVYDLHKRTFNAYLHNGINGWDFNSGSWKNISLIFGFMRMDVNNDGYADYVENVGDRWDSYLYNGQNGWDKQEGWIFPGSKEDLIGADINNDGLPDLVHKSPEKVLINGEWDYVKEVFLYNNKDGWEKVYTNLVPKPINDFNWSIPNIFNFPFCQTLDLDLNNNRLTDHLILPIYGQEANCRPSGNGTYVFNGLNGWGQIDTVSPPAYRGSIGAADDFNNDGWVDYYNVSVGQVLINSANNTFFLNAIKNNRGGEVKITYQNARSFRKSDGQLANPLLKWDKFVVKKIAYFDRETASRSEEFAYQGGEYILENSEDPWSREFAGFHAITAKDQAGNYNIQYFHQGGGADGSAQGEYLDHFSKKGRPYRLERYDQNGRLYDLEINKFAADDLGNNRLFLKLAGQVSVQYDGDDDYRARAKEYDYDNYGNVKKEIDYGEVLLTDQAGNFSDIANDKITTDYEYAANADKNIRDLASSVKLFDQSAKLIGSQALYYDKLAAGAVDKGNLTKIETLVEQVNNQDWFKTEEFTYNDYGLPLTAKNGRGFITQTIYDKDELYPEQIIDAKQRITKYTYDLFYGQPAETTDPNGLTVKNILDGFGRIKEIKTSNPSADPSGSSRLLTKTSYSYNDSQIPNSLTQTDFTQNNGLEITRLTYLDGFSRTIQVRSRGADNNFKVENLSYDERGNLKKKFLPKFSAGPEFTEIKADDLGEEYDYDALNRLSLALNSLGVTSTSYDMTSGEKP